MKYRALLVAAMAFALAACDRPKNGTAQLPASGAPTATAVAQASVPPPALDAQDPCRLLEVKEIEAVLGPLAGPPYRTRDASDDGEPDGNGDACRYDARDMRSLTAAVTWSGGGVALRVVWLPGAAVPEQVKGQLPKGFLPEGVDIAGEWDEARVIGCCRILALRGDSLVALDYAASRATPEQAARLLNGALPRLDKPLALDGRAGIEPARQRLAARPSRRPACGLVTRAEAEAIFGALRQAPEGDDKSCLYAVAETAKFETGRKETTDILNMFASGTQANDLRLTVKWRGGFKELRGGVAMMGGIRQIMTKEMNGMVKMTASRQITGGPWDEAWQTNGGFMAVRKDVLVSIETPSLLSGADLDKRRQIVAKALDKL